MTQKALFNTHEDRPDPVHTGLFLRGSKVWVQHGRAVYPGWVVNHYQDWKAVRRVVIDKGHTRLVWPKDIVDLSTRD